MRRFPIRNSRTPVTSTVTRRWATPAEEGAITPVSALGSEGSLEVLDLSEGIDQVYCLAMSSAETDEQKSMIQFAVDTASDQEVQNLIMHKAAMLIAPQLHALPEPIHSSIFHKEDNVCSTCGRSCEEEGEEIDISMHLDVSPDSLSESDEECVITTTEEDIAVKEDNDIVEEDNNHQGTTVPTAAAAGVSPNRFSQLSKTNQKNGQALTFVAVVVGVVASAIFCAQAYKKHPEESKRVVQSLILDVTSHLTKVV